jgi:ABC-type multidrug transport system ATPase subunit
VRASGGTLETEGAVAYLPQRLGVPQSTVIADLAALVAATRNIAPAVVRDAVSSMGLGDRLDAPFRELSGGQRQRVMLALATVGDVGALLLDEPSISLDIEGAEDVRGAIATARNRGAAVLFASHHLHDVAMLAEQIVLLVEGRVVAQGSLAELAAAAGVPCRADLADPPIERIYRVLVRRSRSIGPARVA